MGEHAENSNHLYIYQINRRKKMLAVVGFELETLSPSLSLYIT